MIPHMMPGRLGKAATPGGYDTDAQAWFTAVEATGANFGPDSGSITTNKNAFNAWFLSAKSKGYWSALKHACFLCGPSTLAGTLVPIVGPAPTNFNFVDADYDRLTGLLGNGTSKYLDTGYASNTDPQNDRHLAVYIHTDTTTGTRRYMDDGNGAYTGGSHLRRASSTGLSVRCTSSALQNITVGGAVPGLFGVSRTDSASITYRVGQSSTTVANASAAPPSGFNYVVYRRGGSSEFLNARLQWESAGEDLGLADLEDDLDTLFAALV